MARPDCPRCGSDLVVAAVADSPSEWVEELRGGNLRAHPAADRHVSWLCRACGHRWEPPDSARAKAELASELESNEEATSPVHEYAKLLKLQPERSFGDPAAAARRSRSVDALHDPRGRKRDVLGATLVLIAIAAVIVIALLPPRTSSDVGLLEPEPSSTPVQVDDSEQEPPPAAPEPRGIRAVLDVHQPCWVEVVADGEVVETITYTPGDLVVYRADRDLQLRLGNAGGVTLRVNGEREETGTPGEVVTLTLTWQRGEVLIDRA
jgi:hypothetical protein